MNKALRNLTSCGLLCLGWQLVAARVVHAELLAFGPPPVSAAPPSNSGATTPPSSGTPPDSSAPGAPAPSPSVPGGYSPQAYPGYPPPSYPPQSYPPAHSPSAPTYPPQSYPPGYYPPPSYPPQSYPPGTYPPAGSPPYYPYPQPQPGYPPPYYQRPPVLRGQPLPLAPGAQTHDGFYLRMQLGLAAAELQGRVPGRTVTYGGAGASAGLAVGYTVASHLTLYLDLLLAGNSGSTPRVNGVVQTGTKRGANVVGLGPGLSFDFGPNLFAAATLLLAGAYVDDDNGNSVAESKSGAALELQFGKEWWVSDNWGLGLSGQFIYGSMKGSDPDPILLAVPDWRVVSAAILFSATYN